MLKHCTGESRVVMSFFMPLVAINQLTVSILTFQISFIVQEGGVTQVKIQHVKIVDGLLTLPHIISNVTKWFLEFQQEYGIILVAILWSKRSLENNDSKFVMNYLEAKIEIVTSKTFDTLERKTLMAFIAAFICCSIVIIYYARAVSWIYLIR